MHAQAVLANKRELATILHCSVVSLDHWIRKNPDFPVAFRGSNGVEWQFDPERVIEFLREKREEAGDRRRREELERAAQLGQFALPIDDLVPESERGLSPHQRAAVARARLAERKLAMESGMLVPVAELRQNLAEAWVYLGKRFDELPRLLASEHGLSSEAEASVRHHLDSWRRQTVAALQRAFASDADLDQAGGDAADSVLAESAR